MLRVGVRTAHMAALVPGRAELRCLQQGNTTCCSCRASAVASSAPSLIAPQVEAQSKEIQSESHLKQLVEREKVGGWAAAAAAAAAAITALMVLQPEQHRHVQF